MALNVLGDDGSLFFSAGIDLEQFKKDAAQITTIIDAAVKGAGQAAAKQDKDILDSLLKVQNQLRANTPSVSDIVKGQFGDSTKSVREYAAALAELEKVRQGQAHITTQKDTGKLSAESADNILSALAKKEADLLAIVSNLGKANDTASGSFETQKKAVDALNKSIDQSTQDLKVYLAAVDQFNKEGVKLPVNQAAPTGKTTLSAAPTNAPKANDFGLDNTLLDKSFAVLASLDEESQAFIENLIKLKVQLKEVEAAQKSLTTQYAKGAVSTEDFNTNMTALVAQEKAYKENLAELVAKQKEYDKLNNSSVGFLNQKKAALAALKKEYGELTEAELKDAQISGQLKKDIAALQQEINGLSLNVINDGAAKTVSLMAQLRQKKQELANTPINDASYQKLFQETAELKDKIADINDAVKLASSDTAGFDAMAQGLRGIAAGFAAVEGVAALFTDDQTKVAQATKNVTAALTILNGVQEIANILDKNSALNVYLLSQYRKLTATNTAAQAVATEGLAAAEGVQAIAAEGATVAQEGLNVAMEANPAGIFLLAITAVVAALTAFSSSTEDAKEKQKAINDALQEGNDLLTQLAYGYSTIDAEATQKADNAVALAQAQGKSEKEILDLKNQALKTRKYENEMILSRLGMGKKELEDAQNLVNAHNEEIKSLLAIKATTGELDKVQKDRLEAVQAETKLYESKINTAKPLISDNDNIQLQLAEAAAEAQKKAGEDSLKSAAALAEARLLLAKKNTAAEYAAQVEAIKARTRLELADVNLTSGERAKALAQENKDLQEAQEKYHALQLNNQKSLLLAKLDEVKKGSADELKLRVDLINQNAAIELAQSGLTEEKKKQIKADAAKALADETKKYNYDTTAAEINTILSSANARLATIQAGSSEELNIKKDLVSQKALLDIATAKNQIENEKQLAAKIEEITAKSLEERRKLDDEYVQHLLDNRLKQVQYENDLRNVSLEGITGSPRGSEKDKAAAQLQILVNNRDALIKQMTDVENALGETEGDHNKLLEKRRELWLQILKLINEINNQIQTADEKAGAKIVADLSKLAGVFNSIGDSVSGLNEKLGSSLKFIGTMVSSLANAKQSLNDFNKAKEQKDTVGQIAGIGGIVGSAVGIVSGIVGLFTKAAEERKRLLAEQQQFQTNVFAGEIQINELYRQRTLEQARLNKIRLDGINAEIKTLQSSKPSIQNDYDKVLSELQKQTAKVLTKKITPLGLGNDSAIQLLLEQGLTIDQINEKFKNLKDTFANISLKNLNYSQLEDLFLKGQLDDKAKALFQTLQALKKEGADVDAALDAAKQKAAEIFTGTTASSLADSIKQGLKQGFRSVQDFAAGMEQVLQDAILSGFNAQVVEKQMQDFYDTFKDLAQSNGGLDKGEIDQLKALYQSKVQDILNQFNQLESVTGVGSFGSTNANNSMAGAIKGVTEQTAEVLSGRLGAIQVSAFETMKLAQQSLNVQLRIENNTAQTVIRLESAVAQLVESNRYWNDVTNGTKSIKIR